MKHISKSQNNTTEGKKLSNLVRRSDVFLQSRHLVIQREVVDERVALWHRWFCMLDAGQDVEGVHVVYELHSELVLRRHGLAAALDSSYTTFFENSSHSYSLATTSFTNFHVMVPAIQRSQPIKNLIDYR